MAYAPLVCGVGGEELGAGEVEDPKPIKRLFGLDLGISLVVCILTEEFDAMVFSLVCILGFEPMFAGLGVMVAVDPPTVLECDVLLEVLEEVEGGHGAAAEEVLRHPAVLVFKVVRSGTAWYGVVRWQKMWMNRRELVSSLSQLDTLRKSSA